MGRLLPMASMRPSRMATSLKYVSVAVITVPLRITVSKRMDGEPSSQMLQGVVAYTSFQRHGTRFGRLNSFECCRLPDYAIFEFTLKSPVKAADSRC